MNYSNKLEQIPGLTGWYQLNKTSNVGRSGNPIWSLSNRDIPYRIYYPDQDEKVRIEKSYRDWTRANFVLQKLPQKKIKGPTMPTVSALLVYEGSADDLGPFCGTACELFNQDNYHKISYKFLLAAVYKDLGFSILFQPIRYWTNL